MPTDIFMTLNFETYNLGLNHILNRRIRDRNGGREFGETQSHEPYVFICTTLWHEEPEEMETLIRTLVRLILHQRQKTEDAKMRDPTEEVYEFEINIFFDNTFESKNSRENEKQSLDEDIHTWKVTNEWVASFCDILRKVLGNYGKENAWRYAHVYPTPYGGRIVYMIEGTPLVIHLKDADEVKIINFSSYKVPLASLISNQTGFREVLTFYLNLFYL